MGSADWDGFFEGHESGRYPTENLVRFVARRFYGVARRADVRLLEIGCGPGANLWYMAREGFSVTGLDCSGVALAQARAILNREGLGAKLDLGDVAELPYPDGCFDAVVDIECLSALTFGQADRAIAEMHRVLKPGGFAHCVTLAVGTSLEGRKVAGEANTYRVSESAVVRRRFGVHRLTSEDDIGTLYGRFESTEYESTTFTAQGRRSTCRQWLITCRKGTG